MTLYLEKIRVSALMNQERVSNLFKSTLLASLSPTTSSRLTRPHKRNGRFSQYHLHPHLLPSASASSPTGKKGYVGYIRIRRSTGKQPSRRRVGSGCSFFKS